MPSPRTGLKKKRGKKERANRAQVLATRCQSSVRKKETKKERALRAQQRRGCVCVCLSHKGNIKKKEPTKGSK
jgi:hypothetical protein